MSEIDNRILAKYLNGDASEEECGQVERWMEESSFNKEEMSRLRDSIAFVSSHYVAGKPDADKAWMQVYARIGRPRRMPFYKKMYRVAAIVLIIVLGGLSAYWYTRPAAEWVVYHVSTARETVYLPDSTEIVLAANSSLRYDKAVYGKEYRNVEMNGKAFFIVKRDKAHPFKVCMKRTIVEVLGTAFEVETGSAETEVSVERGKVAFSTRQNTGRVVLTAGMSARYNSADGKIVSYKEEEANEFAWVTGVLRFNDTPLSEVISDLEDYYQTVLAVEGETGKRLTATFDNMSLTDVLRVINETLDVKLETNQ